MDDEENELDRPVPRTGLRTAGGSPHQFITTGPGIPDDARGPGEELPEAPSDEEVERAAEAPGVPGSGEELPLEGQ